MAPGRSTDSAGDARPPWLAELAMMIHANNRSAEQRLAAMLQAQQEASDRRLAALLRTTLAATGGANALPAIASTPYDDDAHTPPSAAIRRTGNLSSASDVALVSSATSPAANCSRKMLNPASILGNKSGDVVREGSADKVAAALKQANVAQGTHAMDNAAAGRCYNCGTADESFWRYLELANDVEIHFYEESVTMLEGSKCFRACNACGLYFKKRGGVSRPQNCIKEANRRRKRKLRKELASVNDSQASGEERENENEQDMEEEESERDVRQPSVDRTTGRDGADRNSFWRTLSEVCAIDAGRKPASSSSSSSSVLTSGARGKARSFRAPSTEQKRRDASDGRSDLDESEADRKPNPSIPRRVPNMEAARLRDLVFKNGVWRTKRSILENPDGRKAGRPTGKKTGEGEGRRRDREKRVAIENAVMKQEATGEKTNPRKVKGAKVKADDALPQSPTRTGEGTIDDVLRAILSSSSPARGENGSEHARSQGHSGSTFGHEADLIASGLHDNMIHSTPRRMMGQPGKTPLSMGRARYGVPAHLLASSPATAFQTMMDEADTDWRTLLSYPTFPPRRSPRKKPPGVRDDVNPYASNNATSPSTQRQGITDGRFPDGTATAQMSSSSPLTRSLARSGQSAWAWTSSDHTDGRQRKAITSAITSPTSPSPARTDKRKRVAGSLLEAGPIDDATHPASEASPIGRPCKTARLSKSQQQQQQQQQQTTVLDAGPFMGLDAVDSAQVGVAEGPYEGPGSPTLGRSQRLGKKIGSRNNTVSEGDTLPASGVDGAPSDVGDAGGLLGLQAADSEWARNASMQDLFPTPSPTKRWNAGSPSQGLWHSPTSWALRKPTPSPLKAVKERGIAAESKLVPPPTSVTLHRSPGSSSASGNQASQRSGRKPLPATVEDATPSDAANASPTRDEDEEDDDDDEDDEDAGEVGKNGEMVIDMTDGASLAALMSMFDDPYGLLAASGINLPAASHVGDKAAQDGTQSVSSSSNGNAAAIDASSAANASASDGLSHVELFKTFDFAQQMDFFNHAGTSGVAVNAGQTGPPQAIAVASDGSKSALHASPGLKLRVSPRKSTAAQRLTSSPIKGAGRTSAGGEVDFNDWLWNESHGHVSPRKTAKKAVTTERAREGR